MFGSKRGGKDANSDNISLVVQTITATGDSLQMIIGSILTTAEGLANLKELLSAKKKINNIKAALIGIVEAYGELLIEVNDAVDAGNLGTSLNALLAGYTDGKINLGKTDFSNVGLLQIVAGISAALFGLSEIKFPNFVKLLMQMISLRLDCHVVVSNISALISQFDTNLMKEITKRSKSLGKLLTICCNTISNVIKQLNLTMVEKVPNIIKFKIRMICIKSEIKILINGIHQMILQSKIANINTKSITGLVSKITSMVYSVIIIEQSLVLMMAIDMPKSISVKLRMRTLKNIISIICRGLLMVSHTISTLLSARNKRKINKALLTLNTILYKVYITMITISLTMMEIVKALLICGVAVIAVITLFIPLVIGLGIMVLLFFVLGKIFKILAKVINKVAIAAISILPGLVVMSAVILTIGLIMLILSLMAEQILDGLLSIILFMGAMILFLVLVIAFGLLALIATPILVYAIIGIGVLILTVTVMLILATLMLLLVFVCSFLSIEEIKMATDTIIGSAEYIIQSVLNFNFKRKEDKEDGGLIQSILGFVGGDGLVAIFDLFVKVTLLFLTMFVVAVLFVMTLFLIGLTKYYLKNQELIKQSKTAVLTIIDTAFAIIDAVLNADAKDKTTEGDGLFITLVTWVMGDDIASIIKILFKIILIAVSLIVLAMIKFLADEILWITRFYLENADLIAQAPTAVMAVIDCAFSIIQAVLNADATLDSAEADGVFMKLVTFISPELGAIVNLLFKILIIGVSMIVIMMIKFLMDQILWLHRNYSEFMGSGGANIAQEVQQLMGIIDQVVTAIMGANFSFGSKKDEDDSWLEKAAKSVLPDALLDIAAVIKKIGNIGMALIIVGMVSTLAKQCDDTVKILQKYTSAPKNLGIYANNLVNAVTATTSKFNELGADNNLINLVREGRVDKFTKLVGETDKLVNKLNGLNVEKVNSLAMMFCQAAAFARAMNGNIDRLSRAIAEKLEPILKELTEAIENADKHIEERAKNKPENVVQNQNATPTITAQAKPLPQQQKPQEQAARAAQIKMQQQKANNQKLAQDIADALMGVTLRVKMA